MGKGSITAPIGRFFYPARCVLCDRLLKDETARVCPECLTAARVFPFEPWKIPHVKRWIALWQYSGNVREALVRYKFLNRRSYCLFFGGELAQKLSDSQLTYDVVTWVPISRLRRIGRGYDQVELIAQEVGKCLGCSPVKLLHKRRHNRRQSRIHGLEARRKNVSGAYRAVNGDLLRGKRVLLLEDIITTGATVSECARVLKEAGAKEVCAACVAVANRYHP